MRRHLTDCRPPCLGGQASAPSLHGRTLSSTLFATTPSAFHEVKQGHI